LIIVVRELKKLSISVFRNFLFYTALLFLLASCAKICGPFNSCSFVSDSRNTQNQPPGEPSLKISSCPQSVPEGFPYLCQPDEENISTLNNSSANSIASEGTTYSIEESTCSGLEIDPDTGEIFGDLLHIEDEDCKYKIKASTATDSVSSEFLEITMSKSLDLNFSSTSLTVQKDGDMQATSLLITPKAPFATRLTYELFGKNFLNSLSGYSPKGFISVPAGATSVELNFRVLSNSSLTTADKIEFKFRNGSKKKGLTLGLNLHTNDLPNFDMVSSGLDHSCGSPTESYSAGGMIILANWEMGRQQER